MILDTSDKILYLPNMAYGIFGKSLTPRVPE